MKATAMYSTEHAHDATQMPPRTTGTSKRRCLLAPEGCLGRVRRRVARTVLRDAPQQQCAGATPTNKLHRIRDVTFTEDYLRIRTSGAPPAMATSATW
jgi:hypothetical protein